VTLPGGRRVRRLRGGRERRNVFFSPFFCSLPFGALPPLTLRGAASSRPRSCLNAAFRRPRPPTPGGPDPGGPPPKLRTPRTAARRRLAPRPPSFGGSRRIPAQGSFRTRRPEACPFRTRQLADSPQRLPVCQRPCPSGPLPARRPFSPLPFSRADPVPGQSGRSRPARFHIPAFRHFRPRAAVRRGRPFRLPPQPPAAEADGPHLEMGRPPWSLHRHSSRSPGRAQGPSRRRLPPPCSCPRGCLWGRSRPWAGSRAR
jgi:hypothetical protein